MNAENTSTKASANTAPIITVVGRGATGATFRVVGVPTKQDWLERWESRGKPEPWCEFFIWGTFTGEHCPDLQPIGTLNATVLGSFGGELWPTAWPELFTVPKVRSIHNVGQVLLTRAGIDAIRAALAEYETINR